MSNVKNYMEQGGERWIIGGTIEMSDGTHIVLGAQTLKAILDAKLNAQTAAFQEDSTASDVAGAVADFNAMLAKLVAAGLMASE
ncbi:MAG: Head fiber protein [Clostridia bacterium]|jgi:hypothetical protein|nr:Head fiber protein [Clostridia bacterium]MBT7123416.1 Head fiber protein [Clostridia bacterium]